MKLLLDECIDRKLAKEFLGHDVMTVPQMGWAGTRNGQLLALAETEFDVSIAVERNLSFEQNLPKFQISVVVLHAFSNRFSDLKLLVPQVLSILSTIEPGEVIVVK